KNRRSCLSEPWRIPVDHPHWFSSSDSLAAIKWNPDFTSFSCTAFYRSNGIVGVRVNEIGVISVYISPNRPINDFLVFTDRLCDAIGSAGCPVVVCGDFNSHSVLWGSPTTNRRGEILGSLADQFDLVLCNVGTRFTCVRPQGSSIVDLTWASASFADRVRNWCVLRDMETLSDHRLISFSICRDMASSVVTKDTYPRWSLIGLDAELLSSTFNFLSSGMNCEASPDSLAADIRD
ncbi:PREDICTED: uncharacterized protein LOC105556151, partial [Vollenhovia emeryi]|uniref:uncharacterized protein LOC105556151 n=1 Tax=Vollenhovia emeryi TaxID=411798 RepID=UPI0005F51A6B